MLVFLSIIIPSYTLIVACLVRFFKHSPRKISLDAHGNCGKVLNLICMQPNQDLSDELVPPFLLVYGFQVFTGFATWEINFKTKISPCFV